MVIEYVIMNIIINKMDRKYVFVVCIIFVVICGCTRKATTAAFKNYDTECIGKSMDGKQTLRVWASGHSRTDAIKQAKKKAVYDIVFVGINSGNGECNSFPMINESNARRKYEVYFDSFFADGGAYEKFVTRVNMNGKFADRFQGDGTVMYGIIVSVDRSALHQRFVDDNIIVK